MQFLDKWLQINSTYITNYSSLFQGNSKDFNESLRDTIPVIHGFIFSHTCQSPSWQNWVLAVNYWTSGWMSCLHAIILKTPQRCIYCITMTDTGDQDSRKCPYTSHVISVKHSVKAMSFVSGSILKQGPLQRALLCDKHTSLGNHRPSAVVLIFFLL